MKVIYKKSVFEKILEAREYAEINRLEIDFIKVSKSEMEELKIRYFNYMQTEADGLNLYAVGILIKEQK